LPIDVAVSSVCVHAFRPKETALNPLQGLECLLWWGKHEQQVYWDSAKDCFGKRKTAILVHEMRLPGLKLARRLVHQRLQLRGSWPS
jgi:hypothetical protein